jgi:hypothetical protein
MNGCSVPRTFACALAIGLAIGSRVLSQTPGLTVAMASIDGGGGIRSAGTYTLDGTAGQPDAGILSGGKYTLDGGLWPGLLTRVVIVDGPILQIVSSEAVVTVSWTPAIAGFVLPESDAPEGTWRNAPRGTQKPVNLPAVPDFPHFPRTFRETTLRDPHRRRRRAGVQHTHQCPRHRDGRCVPHHH